MHVRMVLPTMAVAALAWAACRPAPADEGEPAGTRAVFAGTTGCASCHREEHAAWDGSQHDRAMQEARAGTVLGDFGGVQVTEGRITSTFLRRDDRFVVRTDAADGTLQDFTVAYTYGVEPLQQYLIEMPGGRLQPLSIAWDSRPAGDGGQRWFHLYAGQGLEAGDDLHWTGREQNWNFMCADCHSTNVRKGYDASADRFETAWSAIDVGCEACHGPGSRHVAWAEASGWRRALFWRENGLSAPLDERRGAGWTVDPSTGRPARSVPRTTDAEIDVCAQCHSRRAQIAEGYVAGAPLHDFYVPAPIEEGLYHADGQQRDEVYTHGSFLQSRMYSAGVTCSDCHDPHSQRLRAAGNELCGTCHVPASYDAPAHHFHQDGSAGAQCVSCHMPETTYMGVDGRRDHRFGVPRPDRSVSLGVPNPCTGCHVERNAQWAVETVARWYGDTPAGFQTFAEAFHGVARGEPAARAAAASVAVDPAQPAIVRASALARLRDRPDQAALAAARAALADPDPMVRRAALLVLEALPPQERIGAALPGLADASRAVRIQAAWLLAPASGLLASADRGAFQRAAAELVESRRYTADRPESRVTLGLFFAQLGSLDEAVAEYQAALRLSPRSTGASVNLADVRRAQGREADAERTLRDALGISPDAPELHHALGLSLARSGRIAESVAALARAAALAPGRADLAYAHAVALHSSGQARDAIRALERALARHPDTATLLFALATFHRDAGETEAALRYARRLAETRPGDAQASALVASLSR